MIFKQGKIETSPGGIEAADGDVTGNNITYSFLYGTHNIILSYGKGRWPMNWLVKLVNE